MISVYRAPWSSVADMKELCILLDGLASRFDRVVITGDFNLPHMCWSSTIDCSRSDSSAEDLLRRLCDEHDLLQIASLPTRKTSLLDLIFVSSKFTSYEVNNIPPFANSDHCGQLLKLVVPSLKRQLRLHSVVQFDDVAAIVSHIDWHQEFTGCVSTDDFANVFTSIIAGAVNASTHLKPIRRRNPLPKHIVRLLRAKQRAWHAARKTSDYTKFKSISKNARAAIRQHRRCQELRMVYSKDRRAFYTHFACNKATNAKDVQLCVNDIPVSNSIAVNILLNEFAANFSSNSNVNITASGNNTSSLIFSCTSLDVHKAILSSSNSGSSPDGVSFKVIKSIAKYIIYPMTIIMQHSFHEGIFPEAWKHAAVIPVFKGRGDRHSVKSYRPISLCPSLGKIMEKVVCTQLISFLHDAGLSNAQHGFVTGRSTVTNLLVTDAHIGDILACKHAYDVICFDFVKAFDKAPHRYVLKALADLGINGNTLDWFKSYLTNRTFHVRVNQDNSASREVTSGVIQGSILGPALYRVFLDPLLKKISLPKQAFADDVKFVADITKYTQDYIQSEINIVAQWADEHEAPISLEKSSVLHCGRQQQHNTYFIHGLPIKSVDTVIDLGVTRSSDGSYSAHYQGLITKARRATGLIRRSLHMRTQQLMWPAFQVYVLPILMYGSSAWNPLYIKDIDAIEKIQRRFTKLIYELKHLPYLERLRKLKALTLRNRRLFVDLILAYKCIHKLIDCTPESIGISVISSSTRGGGLHMCVKRASSNSNASLYSYRIAQQWNKLPSDIICSPSLNVFKYKLFNLLFSQQFA